MSGPLAPIITTRRLLLRPLRIDDAEAVAEHMGDWEVVKNLAMPPWPYTAGDAEEFLARVTGRPQDDLPCNRAISGRNGDRLMGLVGASRRRGFIIVGYWLGRRHWGGGVMNEAASAFIGALFDAYGDDVIKSFVYADNPASLRVQEKLGFRAIGYGKVFCGPRGCDVDDIHTLLNRRDFTPMMPDAI